MLLVSSATTWAEPAPPAMVRVPAGETRIGADQGRPDEQPSFMATVATFDMDRTPVTVASFADFVRRTQFVTEAERRGNSAVMTFGTGQWKLVEGATWRKPTGPQDPDAEPSHPVTHISWNDAATYCAASGKRLPSEAEWEHAARAGGKKDNEFAFGDALVKAGRYRANVWTGVFPVMNTAADGYRTTSPVGAFGPGPLGLTDMAGNVWQWTTDWYKPYNEYAPHPSGAAHKFRNNIRSIVIPAKAGIHLQTGDARPDMDPSFRWDDVSKFMGLSTSLSPSHRDSPRSQAGRGEKIGEMAWNEKVHRGGSFLCDPKFCYGFRVTARGHATAESSHMHVGFRCVKSASPTALHGATP